MGQGVIMMVLEGLSMGWTPRNGYGPLSKWIELVQSFTKLVSSSSKKSNRLGQAAH